MNRTRHLLIGPPLPTQQLAHERLNKIRALAAFSPDALSSIAYANQEIYLGLLVARGARLLIPVALSYYQTIGGYPSGRGSYVVARENLHAAGIDRCGGPALPPPAPGLPAGHRGCPLPPLKMMPRAQRHVWLSLESWRSWVCRVFGSENGRRSCVTAHLSQMS